MSSGQLRDDTAPTLEIARKDDSTLFVMIHALDGSKVVEIDIAKLFQMIKRARNDD